MLDVQRVHSSVVSSPCLTTAACALPVFIQRVFSISQPSLPNRFRDSVTGAAPLAMVKEVEA